MGEPIVYPSTSGEEVQLSDFDNIGAVAGLADDRVLAELLRLAPYDGTNVARTILPFDQGGLLGSAYPGATVVPSGSANGSVVINPFRAVVGSRNTPGAAPSPNPAINYQSNALANWRDVRSGIFIGSTSTLTASLQFAANSSGQPRWDLVYAVMSVDANGPTASRRQKAASNGSVSVASVAQWLTSPVTVGIVQGTPGATPTPPAIPTDSGTNYNFPLAYVRIVNGFTSAYTLSSRDIRSFATSTSRFRKPHGPVIEPATGNNDLQGTYATNFGWAAASAGVRPGPFMPPDWIGNGKSVLVAIDQNNASGSHADQAIVDNSIDWRNRIIRCDLQLSNYNFAWDQANASTAFLPGSAGGGLGGIQYSKAGVGGGAAGFMSQSFQSDALYFANTATVVNCNSVTSQLTSGQIMALYVNLSDGTLRYHTAGGALGTRMFAWLMASPQFPNY